MSACRGYAGERFCSVIIYLTKQEVRGKLRFTMSTEQTAERYPTTLVEAIWYFSDPDATLDFMVQMRWSDGVVCPHCKSDRNRFMPSQRKWQCNGCRKQFSVKVGTIFEDSPL